MDKVTPLFSDWILIISFVDFDTLISHHCETTLMLHAISTVLIVNFAAGPWYCDLGVIDNIPFQQRIVIICHSQHNLVFEGNYGCLYFDQ